MSAFKIDEYYLYRIFLGFFSLMLTACTPLEYDRPIEHDIEELAISKKNQQLHKNCYQYIYGNYSEGPDYALAYEWCRRGAAAGIANSQALLAEMYMQGLYIPRDYRLALQWYHRAAERGHSHAQLMLYHIYFLGLGTPKAKSKAAKWLDKSASNGNLQAIKILKMTL